jgi:hypothetical protein
MYRMYENLRSALFCNGTPQVAACTFWHGGIWLAPKTTNYLSDLTQLENEGIGLYPHFGAPMYTDDIVLLSTSPLTARYDLFLCSELKVIQLQA